MSERTIDQQHARTDLASRLREPIVWVGLIALALVGVLYYPLFFPPSSQELALQSEEFFFEANEAAGAPVLILSLWLFYRRSHYRDLLLGDGSPAFGVPTLALSAAVYVWGHLAGAPDLQLASVIGILTGTVLLLGGTNALRAFWVPIVFLGFALPLPPVLLSWTIFPIQLATAEYAGVILNAMGVESLVQGDQILRPENTFIVIETCSGVRTIVTLSMLTVLLIDLFDRRGWHAVILIGLAPLVAFATNGLRVVTLVLNPHSSIHSIHNLQGIAMLLVGLVAIYLIDGLLERVLGSGDSERGQRHVVTEQSGWRGSIARSWRLLGLVMILISMMAAGRLLTPFPAAAGLAEMPDDLLKRVFQDTPSREIAPDFQFRGSVRYLAHANRRFRVRGEPVEVFLGVGNEQLRHHTLLSKRLAWPASGFAPVEESRVILGPGRQVRRMILRRGARSVLSYSWVERRGSLLGEWFRQALALDRSPLARPERMLAIRISTELGPRGTGLEDAEERIRATWKKLAPELHGYAPTLVDR